MVVQPAAGVPSQHGYCERAEPIEAAAARRLWSPRGCEIASPWLPGRGIQTQHAHVSVPAARKVGKLPELNMTRLHQLSNRRLKSMSFACNTATASQSEDTKKFLSAERQRRSGVCRGHSGKKKRRPSWKLSCLDNNIFPIIVKSWKGPAKQISHKCATLCTYILRNSPECTQQCRQACMVRADQKVQMIFQKIWIAAPCTWSWLKVTSGTERTERNKYVEEINVFFTFYPFQRLYQSNSFCRPNYFTQVVQISQVWWQEYNYCT